MANIPALTQVKWPFGNIDNQLITQAQYTAGYLGVGASGSNGQGTPVASQLWIQNNKTVIEIGTLTGAFPLNLAIDPKLQDGAELTIRLVQGGTAFAVTPGTGFEAATPLSPTVINKTDAINAVLRNGTFVFLGGWSNVR
jgi:hypothetical protein